MRNKDKSAFHIIFFNKRCRSGSRLAYSQFVVRIFYAAVICLSITLTAEAACRDLDAIKSSNELAQSYFQQSQLFHPSRVLKKHSPTQSKEVVSYVQVDNRFYSIFTLVDKDCMARFVKRTRQGD